MWVRSPVACPSTISVLMLKVRLLFKAKGIKTCITNESITDNLDRKLFNSQVKHSYFELKSF